jgi:hypothetical protein
MTTNNVQPEDKWIDNGDGTWNVEIDIDDDLYAQLEKWAEEENSTPEEVLSRILIKYLEGITDAGEDNPENVPDS